MSTTGWSAAAESAQRGVPREPSSVRPDDDEFVRRLDAALNDPSGEIPGSLCDHASTHEIKTWSDRLLERESDVVSLCCNGVSVATYAIPQTGRDESDQIRLKVVQGWAAHEQEVLHLIIRRLLEMR